MVALVNARRRDDSEPLVITAEHVAAVVSSYSEYDIPGLDPCSELGRKILKEAIPPTSTLVHLAHNSPQHFSFKIRTARAPHELAEQHPVGDLDIAFGGELRGFRVQFDLKENRLGGLYLDNQEVRDLRWAFRGAISSKMSS